MPISDFSKRTELYKFIEKVKSAHPTIDILFNNAGNILRKPAAEHPDEYWDEIIEINQNAQFILTREIGKDMISRGTGKIVFTASLLTFQGGINVPGYAASKGAVGSLVKAFANEWASKGVNVNGFAPGYMPRIIPRHLGTTLNALSPFWTVYLQVAGELQKILRGQPYSSLQKLLTMYMEPSLPWMVAGWEDNNQPLR
jgi:NAD(P)-dependent dehydrogenase (short-subunit alcohol dehydrogenase family)